MRRFDPCVRRLRCRGLALGVVGALLASPALPLQGALAADAITQCIAAHEDSLALRQQGKLLEARSALASCAASACPEEIQQACRRRMTALNAAIPTVVFDVKDGAGRDRTDANVWVDGKPAGVAGVTAVPLDPGKHVFRFQAAGAPPVEVEVVLREGQREAPIAVRLRDGSIESSVAVRPREEGAAADASAPIPEDAQAPSTRGSSEPGAGPRPASSPLRTLGYVAGGVGIAGLAVGAVFGVEAFSQWSKAKSDCGASGCADGSAARNTALGDKASASSSATASTIGFAAGGTLLAAGIVLWAASPRKDAEAPAPTATLTATVMGQGGTLSIGGSW